MGKSKKKIIIISVVIAVIIAILVLGVILYLTTDILKSDKTLFFKYLSQNVNIIEQYKEDPNKAEMNNIKSGTYTVNTDINFDLVSSDAEVANQTIPPRNYSIHYTKNADPINNKDTSKANLKYLTKDLFTLEYVHDGDIYALNATNGITASKILNIYLGIENNNLKELAQKLGVQDVSYIPDKIDEISIDDLLNLTDVEREYIKKLLVNTINLQVSKESYYHNKGVAITVDGKQLEANCYGIELNNEQYKNLLIALLNTVSQDETILNIMLQKERIINAQTTKDIETIRKSMQEIITKINDTEFEEGIKIEVYSNDSKLVRTKIEKTSGEGFTVDNTRINNAVRTIISLNYTSTQNNQTVIDEPILDDGYQIIEGSNQPIQAVQPNTYTVKTIEFAKQISGSQNNLMGIITLQINGKTVKVSLQNKTEQNVTQTGFVNNIIINFNDSDTTYFKISATSNILPSDDVTVIDLDETNSAVLNNRTKSNIEQLLNAITAQIQKVSEQINETVQQLQAEENETQQSTSGLTDINQNVAEANTIVDRLENVIQ